MTRYLLVLCLWLGSPVAAQVLPASADGKHLWAAIPSDDEATITLWHRTVGDEPDMMRQVETLKGKLPGVGTAAADGTLWLAYQDGSVQSIDARQSSVDHLWRFTPHRHRSLPQGVNLRSLAADRAGLWAMVHVQSSEVLAMIDEPTSTTDATHDDELLMRNLVLDLPLNTDRPPEPPEVPEPPEAHGLQSMGVAPETVEPETTATPEAASAVAYDRLLQLTNGGWQHVTLPDDWPHNARSAVVMDGQARGWPRLLAQVDETLIVYQWLDDAWQRADYILANPSRWSAIIVDHQLVVGQRSPDRGDAMVALSILRQGRTTPLGELHLPTIPGAEGWALAPIADTATVLGHTVIKKENDSPPLVWAAMDLQGNLRHGPVTIGEDQSQEQSKKIEGMMFIAVLVLALLMLFVFWRRDPRLNQPALPATLKIADLSRRAMAGVIDLGGPVVVVLWMYHLTPMELMGRWPSNHTDPKVIEPGVVAMGFFMSHVLICELIFARTVGKAIVGLRVARLDGTRPRFWQLLVRNLLKLFDLIAWMLLILPILSPFRQRLGDLVAQTLVVTRSDEKADEPQDESEPDD